MNPDKKILFTDLDGTLLNDKREVPQNNQNAIKKAIANGHHIAIATGRPLPSAIKLIEDLGLTLPGCMAITYNGGLIYDCHAKKVVAKKTLPLSNLRKLLDYAYSSHLHSHTYSNDEIISERETSELKQYSHNIKIPYRIVSDVTIDLAEEPVKAIVIDYHNRKRLEEFLESIRPWAEQHFSCGFSSPSLLEFGPPHTSKGTAITYLCDYLGIPIENSIAAGDEENDITMLQAAHIGVAMANASSSIKKYANYITKRDNNHDGIAEVIQKFMNI